MAYPEQTMTRDEQLDFLIGELSPSSAVPVATADKWRLFRALVNVREPAPVSQEFLAVQDAMLQAVAREKGITGIADLSPLEDGITLWQGDITTLRVDAIVNAANSGMLGCFVPNHVCIDNAIHTFAGVQLRLECAALIAQQGHLEPTGKAKITGAYNLPSKHVLHTVGPIITGEVTVQDCELLAACYRACLTLAVQNGLHSVAFCCISTGEFHFLNDRAAEIAVSVVREFVQAHPIKVIFNVFKDTDRRIYEKLLG